MDLEPSLRGYTPPTPDGIQVIVTQGNHTGLTDYLPS